MVNNKSEPVGISTGPVNPNLSVAGSPNGLPVGSGASGNAGAVNTPGGNTGSGGTAAGTSAPGAIPGSAVKARRGLRAELTAVATGIGTQLPDSSETIKVKGQSLTRAQILNVFATFLGLYAAVDSSRQTEKQNRLTLQAALPDARDFLAAVKAALVALFGPKNPVLENFGINPRKTRKLTGEAITAKQAKSNATRELRGTRSQRQKQDVKFTGKVEVQTKLSGTETPATGTTGSTGNPGAAAGSSQP